MSWRTWWSAWSSWWNVVRSSEATTTEEPTTEEPTTTPPAEPSGWVVKSESSTLSPSGPLWEAALADPRCVRPERISIPEPSPIEVDCRAAGSPPDPPPPPPTASVPLRIYERGPKKVFMPRGSSLYFGSESWYFLSGMWTDVPFGEKQLIRSHHRISLYNAGRGPLRTLTGYEGLMMIELLIGTRDGPHDRAPKGTLQHLTGNSAYLRIPGLWHSYASPLNIESYRPFRASVCLTNVIPGLLPFSQSGSPDGAGSPFLQPPSPFFEGWSTACDVLAGMTVELVIEEFTLPPEIPL